MKKGFSLIELVIILAIIVSLSSIGYAGFLKMSRDKTIEAQAVSILSLLDEARASTLGSKNATQYGVHFETTKAVRFIGNTYSSSTSTNIIISFSPDVSISSISLAGGASDVVFQRLTGKTSQTGTVTLSSTVSGTTKVITINQSGVASN